MQKTECNTCPSCLENQPEAVQDAVGLLGPQLNLDDAVIQALCQGCVHNR